MMSILKNLRERTAPLNVKDLAELLDVTEGTIQRWVRRRQVPAIRVGDVIRFDPGMLADWIELQGSTADAHIRGLVVWMGADPRRIDPLAQSGYLMPPPAADS